MTGFVDLRRVEFECAAKRLDRARHVIKFHAHRAEHHRPMCFPARLPGEPFGHHDRIVPGTPHHIVASEFVEHLGRDLAGLNDLFPGPRPRVGLPLTLVQEAQQEMIFRLEFLFVELR